MYNRPRFVLIVSLIGVNAALAVADLIAYRFPVGIGAMLCLTPLLVREVDLRNGLPARQLDKLGWSFILAGALWMVAVLSLQRWQLAQF